jgi:hypothetical protein
MISMKSPRQNTILQRLHHLDHPSHTSSSLSMTDIRLDRTQIQWTIQAVLTISSYKRLRLNRITQNRTRTMRLNSINI